MDRKKTRAKVFDICRVIIFQKGKYLPILKCSIYCSLSQWLSQWLNPSYTSKIRRVSYLDLPSSSSQPSSLARLSRRIILMASS